MEVDVKGLRPSVSKYLGRWVNAYDKARVIGAVTFSESNGDLMMTVTGSEKGCRPGEWGVVPVHLYSYAPDTTDVVAFRAQIELDDMNAFLAMNDNKGLLIIAGYFTFKNNEKQSDFFVREFFSKM